MDNNTLEKLPTGTEGAEAPVIQPEVVIETKEKIDSSETSTSESSLTAETVLEPTDESAGVEVSTGMPTPSAGFPIKSESTGAAKIVEEKMTDVTANL